MNPMISPGSIRLQGKIGDILAWLAQVPADMRLQEYIRLNLH